MRAALHFGHAQGHHAATGFTPLPDAARFRGLAPKEPRIFRWRLAADFEVWRREAERHVCRGRGSGALLRMDRRAEEGLERAALAPAFHAKATAQHLVE